MNNRRYEVLTDGLWEFRTYRGVSMEMDQNGNLNLLLTLETHIHFGETEPKGFAVGVRDNPKFNSIDILHPHFKELLEEAGYRIERIPRERLGPDKMSEFPAQEPTFGIKAALQWGEAILAEKQTSVTRLREALVWIVKELKEVFKD